jgi:hypothetical protein
MRRFGLEEFAEATRAPITLTHTTRVVESSLSHLQEFPMTVDRQNQNRREG